MTVQGLIGNWARRMVCGAAACAGMAAAPRPAAAAGEAGEAAPRRPNILFCISDDQSWAHAGAYGESGLVRTPVFDGIARTGALFTGCFAAAPSCAPARASLLTGRNIWQNEEAGVHLSFFPAKFPLFPETLAVNGYRVASGGKVWGPGNSKGGGPNVAREDWPGMGEVICWPAREVVDTDVFRNFLKSLDDDQPFFFWFGAQDPHRAYESEVRRAAWGDRLAAAADVPPFLPDIPEVREDLTDYAFEIERFDRDVGTLLEMLKEAGRYENTIVVVTGDNGMPFPRAKRELYEYGTHVPLAIQWPAGMPGGRRIDDLVSFIDFGPTFLEAGGVRIPGPMTGRSFLAALTGDREGRIDPARDVVVTGRERHNMCRPENLCYPVRAIRDYDYLYIRNLEPDRDPVGGPPHYADIGYYSWPDLLAGIVEGRETRPEVLAAFRKGTEKRPAEELYAIRTDPGCLHNLALDPAYSERCAVMWERLKGILEAEGDPRLDGRGECFDSAPTVQKNKYGFPGVPPVNTYTPGKMRFDHSADTPWVYVPDAAGI